MMRRVAWIRLFRLLCAGACVLPLVMVRTGVSQQAGTNQTTHKNGSAAGMVYHQQPAAAAQKPAPAATAPKAAQTTVQKQPVAKAQPAASPSVSASPGSMYTKPLAGGQTKGPATSVPAQATPAGAQSPGMYTYKPPQSVQPKAPATQPSTPVQTPSTVYVPPGTGKNPSSGVGTSDGAPTAGTTTPSPGTRYPPSSGGTSDGPSTGPKPPQGNPNGPYTSSGNSDGLPNTGTKPPPASAEPPPPSSYKPPPHPRGEPKRPPPPPPKSPWGPVLTFPVIPPSGVVPPRVHEPPPPRGMVPPPVFEPPQQPVSPPESAPPSAPPAQAMDTPQRPQQQTPKPESPAVPRPDVAKPQPMAEPSNPGGVLKEPVAVPVLPVAALTLTTKTPRPLVGKDVVVVAALEPAVAGASYRLDWGDGSAVETVSGSGEGTHHYAKAKLYKVSASTVVGNSELNHEILVKVGPVAPRIDWLLAALAGLAALFLHFPPVPKVTASVRWGAPGVPEMKLLSREPYLSLSFEPGVGPAEEDITFSKKRRKSGLEQG